MTQSPPVSFGARLLALALSAGCLAVLITAAAITPSPKGVGTHTQLGLQPCQFLARTGVPAPTCGMTTSFAWFVRGNIVASLYVQPMGTALAGAAAATVVAGLYVAGTGRPVHRALAVLPVRFTVIPVLSLAVMAWAWKIFIHLAGIDGWK